MPSFSPNFLENLTRLGLIAVLLAVCLVVAARFRHYWGITPIAVMTGLFQALQTALAVGLSLSVFPGVTFSPGSIVVFPATLFAVLLVYVLEDELEARRLIFGSVLANVTLALLIFFFQRAPSSRSAFVSPSTPCSFLWWPSGPVPTSPPSWSWISSARWPRRRFTPCFSFSSCRGRG